MLFKPPGIPFGEHTLIGRLGAGGLAEVLLATAPGPGRTDRLVVIKRLHERHQDRKSLRRMFLDEARLAARMSHPNVVQTFDLGKIDGQYYMVMQYLEGQPFDRLCRHGRSGEVAADYGTIAFVMSQALDGLHYTHELTNFDGEPLDVVHCDISPHNIVVTNGGTAKLVDFGCANAAIHRANLDSKVVKGKVPYMSPEQTRGKAVDRRADLWSMGVVLWEALTGRRLFSASGKRDTIEAVRSASIPPVVELVPDVPEALARVVDRALQRNPDDRYATAFEMKEDLDAFLAEHAPTMGKQHVAELLDREFSDSRRRRQRAIDSHFVRRDADAQSLVSGSYATIDDDRAEADLRREARPPSRTKAAPRAHRKRRPSRRRTRLLLAVATLLLIGLVAATMTMLVISRAPAAEGAAGSNSGASVAPAR